MSFLSQFDQEKELLFPPLTMLQVCERRDHPPAGCDEQEAPWEVHDEAEGGKAFKRIVVKPTFV